jgi:hypothetical protein
LQREAAGKFKCRFKGLHKGIRFAAEDATRALFHPSLDELETFSHYV